MNYAEKRGSFQPEKDSERSICKKTKVLNRLLSTFVFLQILRDLGPAEISFQSYRTSGKAVTKHLCKRQACYITVLRYGVAMFVFNVQESLQHV